jgi:hypothetical protein
MFDPTSRYYEIETVTLSVSDAEGQKRQIAYKRRRFIPSPEGNIVLLEHTVAQQDRLDNIASSYLGDPTQFWRLCDVNHVLQPWELTREPGLRIKIALSKY